MTITYEGQQYEVKEGTTIREAFKKQIEECEIKDIIAARLNNKIESLDYPIDAEGELEFFNHTDKDGRIIYIRGLLFIMSKAFADLYPDALLTMNYQLSDSMYGSIDNIEVTDEMILKVKNYMQEIIDRDIPIRKVIMTRIEAEAFYKKANTLNGKLQTDIDKERISLYYCEDYFNYFFGTMPVSTGFAKLFDLVKYRKGFLVRYPSVSRPYEIKPVVESKKLQSALEEYDEIYRLFKVNTVHRLNNKIREKNGQKKLILFSEALHEKKIAEIASEIKKHGAVRMVLIAGPSSSGKTTFAKKLGMSLRVNGIKPRTISVDNYFVERTENPKDEFGNYDFECIEALDIDLFNHQLIELINGNEVSLPTFNFNTGMKEYRGNTMKLADDEVLVIEGIHCMNDKLTNLIPAENKFKVYISDLTVLNIDYYNRISTTDTRLIRRIVRDFKFRGYSAEHTLRMWYSVNRGEHKNIFPYQEEANIMFNSSIIYELSVLKKYALPLLEEIPRSSREYSEARRLVAFLRYFEDMPDDLIPNNSLLREFIGGSIFFENN